MFHMFHIVKCFFNKVAGPQPCNFISKRLQHSREIFKSTYFEEQLRTAASILKNVANFREKHLRQSLFLIRLQAWRPALLLKTNFPAQVFSCEIGEFLTTQLRWLILKFFTEQHDSESKGLFTSWKLKIPC